jgi:adhesin transport system membrane fusion protein
MSRNRFKDRTPLSFEEELSFLSRRRTGIWASTILWAILLFFTAFFVWAGQTSIDEYARGQGRVIPSSHVQVVQNLEGGMIREILAHEGQRIGKGEVLIRLDRTMSTALYQEKLSAYHDLQALTARLEAEIENIPPTWPEDLNTQCPELISRENALLESRIRAQASVMNILTLQQEQQEHALRELQSRQKNLKQNLALAREELEITRPIVARGATSKVELLRLKREVSRLAGELEQTGIQIPKARAALAEASRRIREEEQSHLSTLRAELNEKKTDLASMKEALPALKDRMVRTKVRSPVTGTVKKVLVTTVGEVVSPGASLMEIVPHEDTLLVEAMVSPTDIAFLHPEQKASVTFTAYDFSIYGGLDGELENISADSTLLENGQSYYTIKVRTAKSHLGTEEKPLPIIPGMVAQVDILTGKKTVLDYILKPLIKARHRALRER